jgi:hypothetical protein
MKKSTTPKADIIAQSYRDDFARHGHKNVTREGFYKTRCDKCDSPLSFVMSGYAFHQGPTDNCMICRSGHIVWLHITEGEK